MLLCVLQHIGVPYHPHLGEVNQAVLGVVGCSLLDKGQVGQVHSQVGNTGRVAAEDKDRADKAIKYTKAKRNKTVSN